MNHPAGRKQRSKYWRVCGNRDGVCVPVQWITPKDVIAAAVPDGRGRDLTHRPCGDEWCDEGSEAAARAAREPATTDREMMRELRRLRQKAQSPDLPPAVKRVGKV